MRALVAERAEHGSWFGDDQFTQMSEWLTFEARRAGNTNEQILELNRTSLYWGLLFIFHLLVSFPITSSNERKVDSIKNSHIPFGRYTIFMTIHDCIRL